MLPQENLLKEDRTGDVKLEVSLSDDRCCSSCLSLPLDQDVYMSSHEDPDVIIPEEYCFPLLISSHLLLVTAVVAACYRFWILFGANVFLYITSILHWRKPRFSTIERKLDYLAVITNIVYGTIFSMSLNTLEYKLVWFFGLFIIGIFFCINEVYMTVQLVIYAPYRIFSLMPLFLLTY